jgi:hypothetical protein
MTDIAPSALVTPRPGHVIFTGGSHVASTPKIMFRSNGDDDVPRYTPAQQRDAFEAQSAEPDAATLAEWRTYIERGKRKLFTVTVLITPELAKMILANNPINRNKSTKRQIPRIARSIKGGRWRHNGETIKIAVTEELLDGQNRLEACVITGIPIISEVVFGVALEVGDSIDTGISRNLVHVLQRNGYKTQTSATGHGAGLVMAYDAYGRFSITTAERPDHEEVTAWMIENPAYARSVQIGTSVGAKLKASQGVFCALHYLFARRDRDAADIFFDRLREGDNLNKGDPVHRFREYVREHRPFDRRADIETLCLLGIKAFNLFRRGGTTQNLRLTRTEKTPVLD